jgi:hypothetical protein
MTITQRQVLEGNPQNHQTIVQNTGNPVTALAKPVNSSVAHKNAVVELGIVLFGEVIPSAIAEESLNHRSDEARSDLGSSMNDIDTELQVLTRQSSHRPTRLRSRRDSMKPSRSVGISGRALPLRRSLCEL